MRKCKGHPKGFALVRDGLKKNIPIIIKDNGYHENKGGRYIQTGFRRGGIYS